jgi:cytochrome bd ubiquinol oxidase subunit I
LARKTGPVKGCCSRTKPSQPFFLRQVFSGFLSSDALAFHHGFTCSRRRWWRWEPRSRRSGSWLTTAGCKAPVGYAVENGEYVPANWLKIVFSPVLWVRFPHMLLASCITGAFCVAATGAWYLLRGKFHAEARIMLRMVSSLQPCSSLSNSSSDILPAITSCHVRHIQQRTRCGL